MLRTIGRPLKRLLLGEPPHAEEQAQVDIWSISIYRGDSPFALHPDAGLRHPVMTAADVSDMQAAYVADPFMTEDDEGWHMYFEVLPEDRTGNGVIAHATSRDGREWHYDRVVLREDFHLSYPYVFGWKGELFMVPESYQANAIRLYRRTASNPETWSLERTLIEGADLVDSSPFQFRGKWWMFSCTGVPPLRSDTLRLFWASELEGPWQEHAASPVVQADLHIARPGGRVLVSGERIFRFAQDCSPAYGLGVRAFEVIELSETSYAEQVVRERPILEGTGVGWNADGMHHVDVHHVAGEWMACVDGWYLK